jgi:hypothetical protein
MGQATDLVEFNQRRAEFGFEIFGNAAKVINYCLHRTRSPTLLQLYRPVALVIAILTFVFEIDASRNHAAGHLYGLQVRGKLNQRLK